MTIWQYNRAIAGRDAIGNSIRSLEDGLRRSGHKVVTTVAQADRSDIIQQYPLFAEVERRIKSSDTILIHYSFLDPDILRILSLNCRRIMVYHNVTPGHFFAQAGMPGLAAACDAARAALNELSPRFDKIICDSAFNFADLPEDSRDLAQVIPVLTQHEELARQPVEMPRIMELRSSYKLVLLFIGRLVPNKRIEHLIQILATYRSVFGTNACLIIVGKTWDSTYTARLHSLAIELGVNEHVKWLGDLPDSDIPSVFRAADIYLSCSEHEGFGVPILESMAMGLPVVAFDAGAVSEILGDSGIILSHKFIPLWAGIIAELAMNQRLRRDIIFLQYKAAVRFSLSTTLQSWNNLLCKSH